MYGENKTQKKKKLKKRFIRIFWWTLFFHAMIFLVILDIAFKKTPKIFLSKKPLPKLLQKPQNELPASLKPRKSVFGSTVLFDDKADFKPPQSKLLSLTEQPGADSIQQTIKTPEQIPTKAIPENPTGPKENLKQTDHDIKKEETKPPEKKVLSPKKSKFIESKILEPKIQDLKITKKENPPENPDITKTSIEKDKLQKKIDEIIKKQTLVSQAKSLEDSQKTENSPPPNITKIKTPGTAEKDKSPIKTPRKSIIAMTRGFVDNLKDEGEDWLERKGDDNKRPSFEELKYISYEEKVNWHLQNSWKQNFAHNAFEKTTEGKALVAFKIKENGDVVDLEIVQTSGNIKLDNLIVKSVELASPFPPLPKHFEKEIYQTGRIFHVTSQRMIF